MKLTFKRRKQFVDMARAYKIMIDEKEVESIKFGQEKIIDVPEGKHEVYLKIDWCSSNTITVENDGSFSCYNTFAGWKMFTLIFPFYYITFGRKKYLTLEEG